MKRIRSHLVRTAGGLSPGGTDRIQEVSRLEDAPPLVAFVHIPKTAGATATSFLVASYPSGAVGNAGNFFKSPERSTAKIARSPRHPGQRILVGHVPYGLYVEHLPPSTRYITFLREPVDRVLSHYHRHVRPERTRQKQGPVPGNEQRRPKYTANSLEEALDKRFPILENLQTRLLSSRASPFDELPRKALDEAKANLERFAFVGVADRFDESIVLLGRALDLGIAPYQNRHVNSNRPTIDEISDEQRSLIEDRNRLDLELYAFATQLFENAVEAGGKDLAAGVEELRRLCALDSENSEDEELISNTEPLAEPSARRRLAADPRKPRSASPRKLLVFVHIPKTAGTVVTRVLRLNEPSESYHLANIFKGGGGVVRPTPYGRMLESVREADRVGLLYGHIPFGIDCHIPVEWHARYLTFLREPVERSLSHYFQQLDLVTRRRRQPGSDPMSPPWLTENVPFDRAFADLRYVPDNLHTRMLCGIAEPFDEVTSEMLERAKENLESRFIMFGIAERFDESLVLVKRRLGCRDILYDDMRVSASRPRGDRVPAALVEAAERANRYDIDLYRFATELFDATPELKEPDFQAEVAALRLAKSGLTDMQFPSPSSGFPGGGESWRMLVEAHAQLLQTERQLGRAQLALRQSAQPGHRPDDGRESAGDAAATHASDSERLRRQIEKIDRRISGIDARLGALQHRTVELERGDVESMATEGKAPGSGAAEDELRDLRGQARNMVNRLDELHKRRRSLQRELAGADTSAPAQR